MDIKKSDEAKLQKRGREAAETSLVEK